MDTGKSAIDCMKTQSGIKRLARQKLAAARCLLENEHYDDAYYLAGYSIELSIKAVICKTLGVDDFFEFLRLSRKENYRAYKSHNYEDLFVLSGLQPEFDAAQEDPEFVKNWIVVQSWNESSRYECDREPARAKDFVKSSEIICIWIQKHL